MLIYENKKEIFMTKPTAIVYTTKMGHTRQYAEILSEITGLKTFSLDEALKNLPKESPIIYLGNINASCIKGFSRAVKRFRVCAVCGVGLCDTGTLLEEVRAKTAVPAEIPLFTLQGGINRDNLKGADKMLISMLIKGLEKTKQRSEQDERMLELLSSNANFVSRENLSTFLKWYSDYCSR